MPQRSVKNVFAHLPRPTLRLIQRIGREADRKHLPAYVVGGFVRDAMLGRPNFDIDIVVEGNGPSFAEHVGRCERMTVRKFGAFGTAVLASEGGGRIDIATARREVYSRPGALPVVKPGTITEDLFRRDFTINALAVAMNSSVAGSLIDPCGGRADLRAKIIRVLHERSFCDDATRILRAVRFERRLRFGIERRSLRWLKSAIQEDFFETISPPRLFAEFRKFFAELDPVRCLRRLYEVQGLVFVARDFCPDWRLLNRVHQDLILMRRGVYRTALIRGDLIYLLAFFARSSGAFLQRCGSRFQLTRYEQRLLSELPRIEFLYRELDKPGINPSEVYQQLHSLPPEVIILMRAATRRKMVRQRIDRYWLQGQHVKPALTGYDLQKLGVPTGRMTGDVLAAVLQARLDGAIHSRTQEMRFVQQLMKTEAGDGTHGEN